LLRKLFETYDPLERPVENENETLTVNLGLYVQQIVDINEKHQTLELNGWLSIIWNDYNLKWDPAEYGNIQVLRVPSVKIWVPGLYFKF
jgi:hypothetical protein